MSTHLFVLGGVRSGKSGVALRRAETAAGDHVGFVATARLDDDEFADRIARHRAERPPGWLTVEAWDDPAGGVTAIPADRLVLLDSLALWVGSLVERGLSVEARWADLQAALQDRAAGWILVSDETGLAPVALTATGRRFVDALGWANQRAAQLADEAVLVVAGIPVPLKP